MLLQLESTVLSVIGTVCASEFHCEIAIWNVLLEICTHYSQATYKPSSAVFL